MFDLKVGDIITIDKLIPWYKNTFKVDSRVHVHENMVVYSCRAAEITRVEHRVTDSDSPPETLYKLDIDGGEWTWVTYMFQQKSIEFKSLYD